MKIKKLLISVLLIASISAASADNSSSSLLLKKHGNSDSLLASVTLKFSVTGWCYQTCQMSYNNCLANATTPRQIEGCSIKLEVCNYNCSISPY